MPDYHLRLVQTELAEFSKDSWQSDMPVTDPLCVSVLMIEGGDSKWCLISVDTTELNTHDTFVIRKEASALLDMDFHDVWITVSHTHSALIGDTQFDFDKFSAGILNAVGQIKSCPPRLVDRVAMLSIDTGDKFTVNRRAYIDGVGSFSAYQCAGCQDDGERVNAAGWVRQELKSFGAEENEISKIQNIYLDGQVDGVLQLLLFACGEKTLGGVVRFNAHPVVLSSGFCKPHLSRDYCGILIDRLAEMWECPICFMQGPAGNQRTRHTTNTIENCTQFAKDLAGVLDPEKVKPEWKTFSRMDTLSQQIKCSIDPKFQLDSKSRDKRISEIKTRLGALKSDSNYLAHFKKLSDELWQLGAIESLKSELGYINDQEILNGYIEYEISAVRFGEIILIGANSELGNFFSLELFSKFDHKTVMVTAYVNGCNGYILEPEDFLCGGYETAVSVIEPENAEQILSSASGIVSRLQNKD